MSNRHLRTRYQVVRKILAKGKFQVVRLTDPCDQLERYDRPYACTGRAVQAYRS